MKTYQNLNRYEKVVIRKWYSGGLHQKHNHPIHGLDTETYKGYARLITDDRGKYVKIEKVEDVLRFLTRHSFEPSHNFFFNLKFDAQAILKWLGKEKLKEIKEDNKTEYGEHKITYIPKKLLSVKHHSHTYDYFDVAQFYGGSLAYNAEKYLGMKKNEGNIDAARLNTDMEYWKDHYEGIIQYCIMDSKITKNLGFLLQETFKERLKLAPKTYVSKGGVSEEYFRNRCVFPDIRKIKFQVLKYAFAAYRGGRFEVLKRGHFDNATLIDINSAYPEQIANLRDFEGATYEPVGKVSKDAVYGFYRCKVKIPYCYIAPFGINKGRTLIYYPAGEFVLYITKQEYDAYKDYAECNIIDGWEVYIDREEYPFRDAIYDLYKWKRETPKTDYKYNLTKIVMNALYGKFYQTGLKYKGGKAGRIFNPIYATVITANTRIKLFSKAQKYGSDVISFATDSILLPGDIKIDETLDLGGWSVDAKGECVVLQNGLYQIGDKVKSRGIRKVGKFVTPYGRFPTMFDYIKARPELKKYPYTISRPVGLNEAITRGKTLGMEKINVWEDFEKTVDINSDHKRAWLDNFNSGGELFSRCVDSVVNVVGFEGVGLD